MKNVTLKQSAASSGSSICGTFEQFGTQCHTLPHTHTGVWHEASSGPALRAALLPVILYILVALRTHFHMQNEIAIERVSKGQPGTKMCLPPASLCLPRLTPHSWAAKCPVLCAACRSRWLA